MKCLLILLAIAMAHSSFAIEKVEIFSIESKATDYFGGSNIVDYFKDYESENNKAPELIEELRDVIEKCILNCND